MWFPGIFCSLTFASVLLLLPLNVAGNDLSLVEAAKLSDVARVRELLNEHAAVNAPEPDGATALAWAVYHDDFETAQLLIRAKANVNLANVYGATPLSLACSNASATMVNILLTAGANPNVAVWTGETALMTCARTGNLDAVRSLLSRGAKVNARESREGYSALMWAAAKKHPTVTEQLIVQGADVHAKTVGGFTALHFAAQQGDIESAKMLLAAGADVNAPTPNGDTPLLVASASGNETFAIYLLDAGANANAADHNGITSLHYAMMSGLVRMAGIILKYAPYLQRPHMVELIKALLNHGANPNARLLAKTIPFESGTGYGKIMRLSGIPPGRVSPVGATPFLLAAVTYDAELMRLLAANGADPSLTTEDNVTALMLASGLTRKRDVIFTLNGDEENRALEAVKVALELGADVNAAETTTGLTALHGAVFCGATRIIQLLVAKGANLEAKDKAGQTPIEIALNIKPAGAADRNLLPYFQRKEIVDVLVKLGAKQTTVTAKQTAEPSSY